MDILLWLVPPLVVTFGAMLWVTWLGRAGRGEVDRDVAVRRLARALEKDLPHAEPRWCGSASAAPASPFARPETRRSCPRLRGLVHDAAHLAGILAVPLLVALWAVALSSGLPYVTYQPGVTVDVLSSDDGKEIVQVSGHKTYRDDGQLRMTTVYVTRPQSTVNLFEATGAWISRDDAVIPYDAVYSPDETQEDSKTESAVEMVSSQDSAIASALTELGYDVSPVTEVLNVGEGMPAAGKLEVRDVLLKIDGTTITSPDDVVKAVRGVPAGSRWTSGSVAATRSAPSR